MGGSKRRKIAVVTTSRADYSHLYWVLRGLQQHPGVDLRLIACAAHLSEEFGRALDEVERDGFAVDERIECLLSSDTDTGMAKTIGVASLAFSDVLSRMRPDLLLLIADRYEMLAPAVVALALRIPIAHIEGGEVSEGAIDDAVRNALTKMSHLHFVPTRTAERRVVAMGEEPWRVHRVGAPSLDHLRRSRLPDRDELASRLGTRIAADAVLIAYHPVTMAQDTLVEADEFFSALQRLDRQLLFCFPNADAGSRELARRAHELVQGREGARLWTNLNPVDYWGVLGAVGVMLGNSSSGIMEAASLGLPVVNVGRRQQGRERASNVIDAGPRAVEILDAVRRASEPHFRSTLAGIDNPYGDGRAAQRICRILGEIEPGETLLVKRAMPVSDLPGIYREPGDPRGAGQLSGRGRGDEEVE